ncbi:DEAD/DEAH box helicase [Thermodesulfobacteriota bacterium]
MKITLTNKLFLEDIPSTLRNELTENLTIPNPKWIENHRMGRWNRGTPKHLKFYEKGRYGRLYIPRGYIRQLLLMCKRHGESYGIDDKRRQLKEVSLQFQGRLKPFQNQAVKDILKKEFGTLSAPTGSGKTVMALYIIACRRQPTLIVVHTKDLAFQWIQRISAFLNIMASDVGLIGAGKHNVGKMITVGLVQSLYKCADEVSKAFGHLIVDECHRTPSRTFTDAVTEFDSKFMLGLSATPWRRDQLSKLIFWHLGDVRHQVDKEKLIESGDVLSAKIIFRETDFKPFYDPVNEYTKMLTELVADDDRNRLIAADVAREARKTEGVCLVLSDRKHHCETLQTLLKYKYAVSSELLTGDLASEQRRDVLCKIDAGQVKVVVATGQLVGEGLDCKNLSTLFLTTPIKFGGRVLQYLGRVLRPAPGKDQAKVYDYVDLKVGPLKAAARARRRVYGTDAEFADPD